MTGGRAGATTTGRFFGAEVVTGFGVAFGTGVTRGTGVVVGVGVAVEEAVAAAGGRRTHSDLLLRRVVEVDRRSQVRGGRGGP